jgi:hypothetical protein
MTMTMTPTVSDSEEDDMDNEDYREILSPVQSLPLPFQLQELSRPKHMPPPDSPPIASFHFFFTDLILNLMVTESSRYAQQVISSPASNVHTPPKNWTRITMHEVKGFLVCILIMGIIEKPKHHTGPLSVPKPPQGLGKCLPSIALPTCCASSTWSTKKDCQALVNQTVIPVEGTNPWWIVQTGYSGIATPLIKKLVLTKAW